MEETIKKCPNCLIEIKENTKVYYCSKCEFKIWKDNDFLKKLDLQLSEELLNEMLKNGKYYLQNLYSKKKEKFYSAYLVWKNKEKGYLGLEFPKVFNEKNSPLQINSDLENTIKIIGKCPNCLTVLTEDSKKYYCSNCEFKIWKNNHFFKNLGIELSEEIIKTMLETGKYYLQNLYSAKKEKYYSAYLIWKNIKKGLFDLEFPTVNNNQKYLSVKDRLYLDQKLNKDFL